MSIDFISVSRSMVQWQIQYSFNSLNVFEKPNSQVNLTRYTTGTVPELLTRLSGEIQNILCNGEY